MASKSIMLRALQLLRQRAEKEICQYEDMAKGFTTNPFEKDIAYWRGYRDGVTGEAKCINKFWEGETT